MIDVAAVGSVAGCASLGKGGLVMHRLCAQVVEIVVASEADGDGVGFGQAGLAAGMGAVAIGAIAHGSGMGYLGAFNLLGFVVVAGNAEGFGVWLGKDDFSVLGWSVAHFAASRLIGRVLEFDHELGRGRLVGVVALHAVGGGEGLALMRFLQVSVFGVVAVEAERRGGLGEMEAILHRGIRAGFVGGVAGVATHIERGVTAALFRDIQAGLVAIEAEIFLLTARGRLEELVLIGGGVRVVAGETVADRGRMHGALDVCRCFVGMAGEAERGRSCGDELDARDIFSHADFMAAQTTGGHGGVNRFAFGLVLMTFKALDGIDLGIERNGVYRSGGAHGEHGEEPDTDA